MIRFAPLIAALALLLPTREAAAGFVTLSAAANGYASRPSDAAGYDGMNTTDPTVTVGRYNFSPNFLSLAAVLEFDLSPLAGKTILSATLRLQAVGGGASTPVSVVVLVSGYAGDGVASSADLTAGGATALGSHTFSNNGSAFLIDGGAFNAVPMTTDATSFVAGIVGGSQQYAGFRLITDPSSFSGVGIDYTFGGNTLSNTASRPALDVTFADNVTAAPAPPGAVLLGVGMLGMLGFGVRRQKVDQPATA